MNLKYRLAIPALLLAPCLASARMDVLSPQGYGSIRFGMTLAQAQTALKQKATPKYSGSGCSFVQFRKYPPIRFMVEDSVITRADAKRNVSNTAAIQIGMALSKVKALHPDVVIEPHKYDPQGHYLILDATQGRAAIVLEESQGRVTGIRAGLKPSVEYVEGCS